MGERGAIRPSEESLRSAFGLRESKDKTENALLNSDARACGAGNEIDAVVGVPGSAVDNGKALSLALKLRNKKSGASQTQTPKNVAISTNPGVLGIG